MGANEMIVTAVSSRQEPSHDRRCEGGEMECLMIVDFQVVNGWVKRMSFDDEPTCNSGSVNRPSKSSSR